MFDGITEMVWIKDKERKKQKEAGPLGFIHILPAR